MALSSELGYGTPHVEGLLWIILSLLETLGVFGVPIFLFISGTFAAYAASGKRSQLTFKFLQQSLRHIFWPYILWSILFYVLIFIQYGKKYELLGYVKNLLVGYPFHFIPLLIFFYLLSPLLVRLSQRYSLLLISGIAAYQICLMVLALTDGGKTLLKVLAPPVIRNTLTHWAIFFPLGLVYGTRAKSILPCLQKNKLLLLFATVGFFVLHAFSWRFSSYLSLCGFLSSAAAVLLLPVIDRQSIPQVKLLENLGKRSYGLYLTHLIVLDLALLLIALIKPGLLDYRIVFLPILYIIAIQVPIFIMKGVERFPARTYYRFIFG